MAAVLPPDQFLAWGWRIPFLLSVVLIVIGIWVRTALEETPVFEAAVAGGAAHKAPVIQTLKDRPWQVVIGGALKFGENVSFYLMTAFGLTYLTDPKMLGLDRSVALNGVLAGSAMGALTMPLWGLLSDKIGRRAVYGFGAAGLIVWAFVFFPLLQTKSPALITLAMMVGVTVHSAMNGPQGAFLAELFPTRIRYSGVSLCYQVTSIVGGSWAPIISLALYKQFQSTIPISAYLAFACAVSFVGVLFARETKGVTFAELDAAAAARQS
jgi:MFS family permease